MLQRCLSKMRRFIENGKYESDEAAYYMAAWDYVTSLAEVKREKMWAEIVWRDRVGFPVYNPKSCRYWGVEAPKGAVDVRDHIITITLLDLWLLPHGPGSDGW